MSLNYPSGVRASNINSDHINILYIHNFQNKNHKNQNSQISINCTPRGTKLDWTETRSESWGSPINNIQGFSIRSVILVDVTFKPAYLTSRN